MIPVLLLFLAQQPLLVNGRLETRNVAAGLERELGAITGPAWAGYAVPGEPGHYSGGDCNPVHLEPASTVLILYRVEDGKAAKIRFLSPDCKLDAGGLPLYWFSNVKPAESVAFLRGLAEGGARDALGAMAAHTEPAATDALVELARKGATANTRGQALFWLAHKADRRAIGAISDALRNDPEVEVKRRAVFALSQLPKDEGVPLLIQVARTHANPAVRKQAFFWLGQSKDPRALSFFEEVLGR